MTLLYRPFVPGDENGIIRIIREFYGDDYYHAECCDPQYLLRASADGRRIIFVAQAENGELAGVAAGQYIGCFPGSYELGMHVFSEKYQHKGYARALLAYATDALAQMHIHGVYGMPVTFHNRSQAECEAVGLISTGFWLGRYRSDRSFFATKPRSPKLHSLVVAAKGANVNSGPLYAPAAHTGYIKDVYAALGLCFGFAHAPREDIAKASSVFIRDWANDVNREIYVRSAGLDMAERLTAFERAMPEGQSWTLFINMLSPGCEFACEAAARANYYFSGIHPLHDGCEYIMLHKEPPGGYIWDELKLTPGNARLLKYILDNKGR